MMHVAKTAGRMWARAALGAAAAGSLALGGCGGMGNYTNPEVSISDARVTGDGARFELDVSNPSDFDLRLTRLDYTVTYGILPVSEGTQVLNRDLPSKQVTTLTLPVVFDQEPMDPTETSIQVSGTLGLEDLSNSSNMAINEATFTAEGVVRR